MSKLEADPAFPITRAEAEELGETEWPSWFEVRDIVLLCDGAILIKRYVDQIVYHHSVNGGWERAEWFVRERRPIVESIDVH